ncbi:MAG: [acyl-carrier-protein] S-malonyltransferase [Flavobacteriales bacterium]|nr:[acyl-carrier-protein] S-malonyltransferase [Flavobacteriales bacterium]
MKAFIFPGQGSQFSGMGKDLYSINKAKKLFHFANEILGFNISNIMFNGTSEDLKQTNVTQPAIFIHSVILASINDDFNPDMLAGHSLGEISALTSGRVLSFEDGLNLVKIRSEEMQKACLKQKSTMAAILQMDENIINEVCDKIQGVVVPANYNCPGQIVISGEQKSVEFACKKLKDLGARRAVLLPVGGAFHSPIMEPAKEKLKKFIEKTNFNEPICPVYQNVTAKAIVNSESIKANLIKQLISPVRWEQSINKMINDGANEFIEVGPGKVLQGLIKKINPEVLTKSIDYLNFSN